MTRIPPIDTSVCDRPIVMVLGYFGMRNLGDELYVDLWKYLAKERFADVKVRLHVESLEKTAEQIRDLWIHDHGDRLPTAIVLGGGDILTPYFIGRLRDTIDRLSEVDFRWSDIPLHGVSVAVPFVEAVELGMTDVFHTLLCRPGKNISHMCHRNGRRFVQVIPDLSAYLAAVYPGIKGRVSSTLVTTPRASNARTLLVCVAAQTCGYGTEHYEGNISALGTALSRFQRRSNCNILYVPFDTSDGKSDDRKIIERLLEVAPGSMFAYQSSFEAFERFQKSDVRAALCMRYHSHMMSLMSVTPIASIAVTAKVTELMRDSNMLTQPNTYVPDLDEIGVPTSLDASRIVDILRHVWSNERRVRKHEAQYLQSMFAKLPKVDSVIRDIFSGGALRPGASSVRTMRFAKEIAEDALGRVLAHYLPKASEEAVDHLVREFRDGEKRLCDVISNADASFVTSMMCMTVTQDAFPNYHYGFSEKVMTSTDVLSQLEWIAKDHAKTITNRRSDLPDFLTKYKKMFCCKTVSRASLWGLHRAGWEYVLKHLWQMHSDDETLPIFDDYCDATFNWLHDVLLANDTIPYRRRWFGVFHHTANADFGPNNIVNVFANPTFQKSLPSCQGIITMSETLASDIKCRLYDLGYASLPVHTCVHPSEVPDMKFSMAAFQANQNKKLVQIGAWYREPYLLYTLDLPRKGWISKAALRGKAMDSNFPPAVMTVQATSQDPPMNISVTLEDGVDKEHGSAPFSNPGSDTICRGTGVSNIYVTNMIRTLVANQHSVTVLGRLPNDEYDKLFTENIVFLHMVDASAVNTIIEAILRNTPVLVNRLPAIVEVLGPDYPMYYDSATEAANKACDESVILDAHKYLQTLDKSQYNIRCFVERIVQIVTGTGA